MSGYNSSVASPKLRVQSRLTVVHLRALLYKQPPKNHHHAPTESEVNKVEDVSMGKQQ